MSYMIDVPLIQHTPLIHFQAEQKGAGLRASEVKPKLDRFLIEKIGWETIREKNWDAFGGDEDYQALDYKMAIVSKEPSDHKDHGNTLTVIDKNKNRAKSNFPSYFADMGGKDSSQFKRISFYEKIQLRITGTKESLLSKIESLLQSFFTSHNFGMRQSRGFGSFSCQQVAIEGALCFFSVDVSNYTGVRRYQVLDEHLNFFNKIIRGGLNGIFHPSELKGQFYMKPLIFQYAVDSGIVWEKKEIKKKWLQGSLSETSMNSSQREELQKVKPRYGNRNWEPYNQLKTEYNRENNADYQRELDSAPGAWPLTYDTGDARIVRDLLGLSTDEQWMHYQFGGVEKESNKITRAPSPFTFSPVDAGDGKFIVYVFGQEPDAKFKGAEFKLKSKKGNKRMTLKTWNDFSLKTFVEDYFNAATIENCVLPKYQRGDYRDTFEHIHSLFTQIENSVTYLKNLRAQKTEEE